MASISGPSSSVSGLLSRNVVRALNEAKFPIDALPVSDLPYQDGAEVEISDAALDRLREDGHTDLAEALVSQKQNINTAQAMLKASDRENQVKRLSVKL